jgi:septal ring factor EnvC (AmiA/AmiB activator)
LNRQKLQAAQLNDQIEGIITVEAESSVKNQEKDNRLPAENKGDYAMTTEEQTLSSKFEQNKGRLPFPVSGKYLITGRFGEQQYEELKQQTVTNGGINIQAMSNNDVKSVFGGEVSAVFAMAGYQNTVIIRHGEYLTVYSNLSSVFVKKGDQVTAGQSVGKIYTDSDAGNTSVLYFQIRKGKTKLNPEAWLRR